MGHLWLRSEVKKNERRTPLIPTDAKCLVDNGHKVTVEQCDQRIFPVEEYKIMGCEIAPAGAWINAPMDAYILGLKNLPDNISPLKHKHIYFAHAFKDQPHAKRLLSRFMHGNGSLYDLEYLVDAAGNRVTAFGFYAGVAGAAIAILLWCFKMRGQKPPYKIPHAYSNSDELFSEVKKLLSSIDVSPSILVIGAYGRCGSGAVDVIRQLDITPILWGRQDTQCSAVTRDILTYDIMLNCIFVDTATTPFLTRHDFINNQNLSIIMDISCEPEHERNPLPFYSEITTFENPTHRVWNQGKAIDLISIDNLPAFLPAESSAHFSRQLINQLNDLFSESSINSVWNRAAETFKRNLNSLVKNELRKVI